jgi:hypothetical protein
VGQWTYENLAWIRRLLEAGGKIDRVSHDPPGDEGAAFVGSGYDFAAIDPDSEADWQSTADRQALILDQDRGADGTFSVVIVDRRYSKDGHDSVAH